MDESGKRLIKIKENYIPQPFRIQINVTQKCNIKCEFCWQRNHDHDRDSYDFNEEISDERLLRLVDEAAELGIKDVLISGNGEPMVRSNIVLKMMQRVKEHDIYGSLTTNGTLFTEEMVKEIVKCGWDRICVSLQSPIEKTQDKIRRSKGSFNRNLELFRWVKKWKGFYHSEYPVMAISPVLYKTTCNTLFETFEFAKTYDIKQVFLTPIKGDSPHMLKLRMNPKETKSLLSAVKKSEKYANENGIYTDIGFMLTEKKINKSNKVTTLISKEVEKYSEISEIFNIPAFKLPCYEPWREIVIHETGTVAPCSESYDINSSINVKNLSLKEIWYGTYFNRFRSDISSGKFRDTCKFCGLWRFNIDTSLRNGMIISTSTKTFEKLKTRIEFKKYIHVKKLILELSPNSLDTMIELIIGLAETSQLTEAKKYCLMAKNTFLGSEQHLSAKKKITQAPYNEIRNVHFLQDSQIRGFLSENNSQEAMPSMPRADFSEIKQIYNWIGNYYFLCGDYKNAIKYFEKNIGLINKIILRFIINKSKNILEQFVFYTKIGVCYFYQSEYSLALTYLKKSHLILNDQKSRINLTQYDGKKRDILYLVGKCYWQLKKYKTASNYFKRILNDDPSDKNAIRNLGECHMQLDNYDQSLELLMKALSLDPFDAWVYFSTAKLYFKINEYQKSIDNLKLAINYGRNIPLLRFHTYYLFSIIYYDVNNDTKSLSWYNKTNKLKQEFSFEEEQYEKKFRKMIQKKHK